MDEKNSTFTIVLKAVALAMGVAAIVLGFMGVDVATQVTLLGIGLFALALAAFQ